MFLKIARDIAKPQTFAILDLVKRSTGLSVNELAEALKMSYMGVKQHCLDLEKKGLLDTWRRVGGVGRPEKAYRLTDKAAAFYPEAGNELTLELLYSIQEIYGPSAPDKLLFNYFGKKAEQYSRKVQGSAITERVDSFAKIRNLEGYCAETDCDPQQGLRLVEFHHPFKEILTAFPNIRQMETVLFQKVLLTEVHRTEERSSGLIRVSWHIAIPVHQALAS